MRAAILEGPKKIIISDVPTPSLSSGQVLLKVKQVGICGTDMHFYTGKRTYSKPIILGHEFVGEIVEVGSGVAHFKKGERVVAEHVLGCGSCNFCKNNQPNLCSRREVIGINRDGALAEYVAVDARLIFPLSEGFSWDQGVLVEPLSIAVYACQRIENLSVDTAAVIGQGMIGIFIDSVLKHKKISVSGFDIDLEKLAFIKKNGFVDDIFKSNDTDVLQKYSASYPSGADVVFEAVGHESTANLSFSLAKPGGTAVLLGVFGPHSDIAMMNIITKELTVKGSWNCVDTFSAAIDLIQSGAVKTEGLITHRYPLSDAARAFEETLTQSSGRIKTVIEIF